MLGTPSQNGVAERQNRTLKDMVRSMISHSTLPESLWGYSEMSRPSTRSFFETAMLSLLRMLNMVILCLMTLSECTTNNEIVDTPEIPSTQVMEQVQGHEELTQQPQNLKIIMEFVSHYDLELYQVDVKIVFLNGNIDETTYMVKPENFESNYSEQLENTVDQCIYLKFSGSKFIILVLYVDDILLASTISIQEFDNLGNASFVLGIQIYRDRSRGSLMYAQVCTRPDIAYIVGMLGRYLSNPEIVGYSDSISRDVLTEEIHLQHFHVGGGAISWKSVKQTFIASSIMEAEFIACYEASNHRIWLRNFITKLQIVNGIEKPLRINCDNKVTELYSKNNQSLSKFEHIDIKFLVVKERVQSLQVSIDHISTNSMIADPLTKDRTHYLPFPIAREISKRVVSLYRLRRSIPYSTQEKWTQVCSQSVEKKTCFSMLLSEVTVITRMAQHELKVKVQHSHLPSLKCANILVDVNGTVKLADFGFAKLCKLNDIKSCKGTAFWMAPKVCSETLKKRKNNGYWFAADTWSLGCTVLEMLTQRHPYFKLEPGEDL
ncbi:hypothetical protein AAG906_011599 [Vitis piasezkii]